MNKAKDIYTLLLDNARSNVKVEEVILGPLWTYCRAKRLGIALSHALPSNQQDRVQGFNGWTLSDLAEWINVNDPVKATIGMAAINCVLNSRELPFGTTLEPENIPPDAQVLEYFLSKLKGKKVVMVGNYQGLERYTETIDLTILPCDPTQTDRFDAHTEFDLSKADWVFITPISIINKSFARLIELSCHTTTVLMGTTVPWFPEIYEFGIDYLVGVEVVDSDTLRSLISNGGNDSIFNHGVKYRVVHLDPKTCMKWLKQQIAQNISEKEHLSNAMDHWYASGKSEPFPHSCSLEEMNARLKRMDLSYKRIKEKFVNTVEHS